MDLVKPYNANGIKRFVAITTLLSLVNPVQAKPSVRSLDKDPTDGGWLQCRAQEKFLDSFALICSTSKKGSETASAACLETGRSTGTVLRVARNLGVPPDDLCSLKKILGSLKVIAARGSSMPTPEDAMRDILFKIIDLDRDKINALFQTFTKKSVKESLNQAIAVIQRNNSRAENGSSFWQWAGTIPAFVKLSIAQGPQKMAPYLEWASCARWRYSKVLESHFSGPTGPPEWITSIYKLGRYYAAANAMVSLALKQSELFVSIELETVEPLARESFPFPQEHGLRTLLKELVPEHQEQILARLENMWNKEDAEVHFKNQFPQVLTPHAEMQMARFYESYPHLAPRLRYMGTSKKACYLCNEALNTHPLKIVAEKCHQKLYPTWLPAPCPSSTRKRNSDFLWKMTRQLERMTVQELRSSLRGVRRQFALDSTAGPSLTMTSYM